MAMKATLTVLSGMMLGLILSVPAGAQTPLVGDVFLNMAGEVIGIVSHIISK
jgi:hypothetical protein